MHILKANAIVIGLSCLLAACTATATPQAAQVQSPNQQRTRVTPTAGAIETQLKVAVDGVLVQAAPSVNVGFSLSTKVTAITATLGQAVKKGDVLATVDDTTLQDAIVDKQLALKLTEANIAVQNAPPSEADIASAQAALNAAYASYKTAANPNTQTAIEKAKTSIDSAWRSYLSAQLSRDVACGKSGGLDAPGCKTASASFGNAFEGWLSARNAYQKILQPPTQSSLSQAASGITSAQTKLDALKAGTAETQIKIDEAQVNQAKADLARAQSDLIKAQLISPCNCVVQAVNIVVGVTPPAPALTLVDLSRMQFKTTNLTERDVAKIKIGATVAVRIKAYTDVFTGKVSAVLAQSSGTQGSEAIYTVLIDLDATPKKVLPGMTGQAEITM